MKDSYFIQSLLKDPIYVVDKDAIELLKRADCAAAIQAMREAGILRLPYPKIVVEIHTERGSPATIINRGPEITKSLAPEYSATENIAEFVVLEEVPTASGNFGVISSYGFVYTKSTIAGVCPQAIAMELKDNAIEMTYSKDIDGKTLEVVSHVTILALNVALVLMNMTGIEREHESHPKLNKAREKTGKQAIPDYTYLKIGHVQRSDGSRVKYNSGDVRTMPMHVRSAHTRRQHYGTNNELTKIIYVPSVIVNFNPGGNVRQKVKVLT